MTIRFDDRVAIVTGAGAGLGRQHALQLAARGAKVVVNDFGGGVDGSGGSSAPAQAVADEIAAAGGEAFAHGADVANPAQVADMVAQAMGRWGRVDILINNAGILRDASFAKVTLDDFRKVVEVHLFGSVVCTQAVWPHMRAANYGRVLMTTSSSGLYGNFGQANYAAAKMAVIGLMNVLQIEGAKNGIHVNALGPGAATRMTQDLLPKAVVDLMTPESVTPAALFLVSEGAPQRTILNATAGGFSRTLIHETQGVHLAGADLSPEGVEAAFARIGDEAGQSLYASGGEQVMKFVGRAAEAAGVKLGVSAVAEFIASDAAVRGGNVRTWILGPAAAPPVVVTHGGGLDHRSFRPLAERLAASGRRVVLWDLPGHGESRPLPRGFGIPLCADALAAVLAHHGVARATHLGFSFGGMVAQVFARRSPAAVPHLIAYGCFTPHLVKPLVPKAAVVPIVQTMWGLKPWVEVRRLFAEACSATPEGRADAARATEAGGRATFLAMAKALLRDWDYDPGFRLPGRVDVISGALDSNGERLRASLAALRATYPDGREVVVEGAGHTAHIDRPDAFARAVLSFLDAAQG